MKNLYIINIEFSKCFKICIKYYSKIQYQHKVYNKIDNFTHFLI